MPYRCVKCNKRFAQSPGLHQHRLTCNKTTNPPNLTENTQSSQMIPADVGLQFEFKTTNFQVLKRLGKLPKWTPNLSPSRILSIENFDYKFKLFSTQYQDLFHAYCEKCLEISRVEKLEQIFLGDQQKSLGLKTRVWNLVYHSATNCLYGNPNIPNRQSHQCVKDMQPYTVFLHCFNF